VQAAAQQLQHKLMQAMLERDRRYKLGRRPRIEIDDAYVIGKFLSEDDFSNDNGRRDDIAKPNSADQKSVG
jgi:hypothetical protein